MQRKVFAHKRNNTFEVCLCVLQCTHIHSVNNSHKKKKKKKLRTQLQQNFSLAKVLLGKWIYIIYRSFILFNSFHRSNLCCSFLLNDIFIMLNNSRRSTYMSYVNTIHFYHIFFFLFNDFRQLFKKY